MNRHSIFFKLNLLFATALIVTVIAAGLVVRQMQRRGWASLMLKSRVVLQELRRERPLSEELLESLDLERVPQERAERILREGRLLHSLARHRGRHRYSRGMLRYGGEIYLVIRTFEKTILLHPRRNTLRLYLLPAMLFLAILALLSLSYWTLRRSLDPMRRLEEDIRRYGRGEALRYREFFDSGRDELAEIARAFYASVEQLQRYGEARRLFLRNLLHELNTPVTKGKLLAELSEEPRTRRMLGSIFERLSSLLGELVEVERIAASPEPFTEREKLSADELLEEACRRLYCEKKAVRIEIPGEATLFADREAMVIVFKNLLDNALKYGREPGILLVGDFLEFRSRGPALSHPLDFYTEPFRQEYGSRKKTGFGLGLYLVREILERHGMSLRYRYEAGENVFAIGPL